MKCSAVPSYTCECEAISLVQFALYHSSFLSQQPASSTSPQTSTLRDIFSPSTPSNYFTAMALEVSKLDNSKTTATRILSYASIWTSGSAFDIPSNATMTSGSAAQEVFDLPELLEMILLQLTPEPDTQNAFSQQRHAAADVFIVQRVNRTFQSVISTSKSLQEQMCLRIHPEWEQSQDPQHMVNWLVNSVGITDVHDKGTRIVDGGIGLSNLFESLSVDTLLSDPLRMLAIDSLQKVRPQDEYFGRPEASWRNMTARCVGDDVSFQIETQGWHRQTHLRRFTRNMTLGEVHDGLQKLIPAMVSYEKSLFEMLSHWAMTAEDPFWKAEQIFKDEYSREDLWL